MHVLLDSLTGEGVRQWLQAPNAYIADARPTNPLLHGQDALVLEAVRPFVEGSYLREGPSRDSTDWDTLLRCHRGYSKPDYGLRRAESYPLNDGSLDSQPTPR